MSETVKNVLVIVTADPKKSGRVAEAVRIAAGVGSWEKVAVKLCLCGEARLALQETDELVNGDVFDAYLPLLLEEDGKVLSLAEPGEPSVLAPDITPVTVPELAAIGREAHSVLRF